MSEVLSQSQIDALLNSMHGDGTEDPTTYEESSEKKFLKYDFHSPKKFTKDKLKIVSSVHENYARLISSQINSLYRVNNEVELITVEEQRYYEFRNALSDNDVITLATLTLPEPAKIPPIIIHISPEIMVDMMDRMLGGVGGDAQAGSDYVYTSIEKELYVTVAKYIVNALADAWSNYLKVEATFQRVENPGMMQSMGADEIVVLCILDVTMKFIKGKITICLPSALVENIFSIFEKRANIAREIDDDEEDTRSRIMDTLKDSTLEVKAQLGDTIVSLYDIYSLHVGDVVNLNKPKDSDVTLTVEGNPWFSGKLGTQNKSLAIAINGISDRITEDLAQQESEDPTD